MNKPQLYQPILPTYLQKKLDQQLAGISQIGQAVFFALEGVSTIHRIAVFEAISTSATVSVLKKASETNGMTPELEAHLKQLEQSYFSVMHQIPQEACEKIIHSLKEIDVDKDEVGFIAEVKNFFQQLLDA